MRAGDLAGADLRAAADQAGLRDGVMRRAERAQPDQRAARATALKGAGTLAWNQGDYPAARPLLEESVAMWREVGNKQGLAHALLALGVVQIDWY
jgi:Tetratricopeptide repeat